MLRNSVGWGLLLASWALAQGESANVALLADRLRVPLGEPVRLTVIVQHHEPGRAAPLAFNFNAASLRVGFAGREFLYTRYDPPVAEAYCEHNPKGRFSPPAETAFAVLGGQSETLSVELILPKVGRYELVAGYRGRTTARRETGLFSHPLDLEVVAPESNPKARDLRVIFETELGSMTLGFWPEEALGTVLNFIDLTHRGFYDNAPFHRIIDGFMSQGGDPTGTGEGGPGYTIPHEFNARRHRPFALSMARDWHSDSAGSQFFICAERAEFLDRSYTAFGEVVSGREVAQALNDVGSDDPNGVPPRRLIVITKARLAIEP